MTNTTEPTTDQLTPFVDSAFHAYVEALLWTSTDDSGEPMDEEYGPEDFAEVALHAMREDVQDFVYAQWTDVQGMSPEQVGHNFLLTRNGHGAGFWDRGLGDVGDRLTKECRPYGSVHAYVGDDGMVYAG